jgi:hypothetical protein
VTSLLRVALSPDACHAFSASAGSALDSMETVLLRRYKVKALLDAK